MRCRHCHLEAPEGATECAGCGLVFAKWNTDRARRFLEKFEQARGTDVPWKNPALAGAASFLVPGVGQIFCGYGRGIVWLIVFVAATAYLVSARIPDIALKQKLTVLLQLILRAGAAWDACRCGFEKARGQARDESPAPEPPPEGPPVPKDERIVAGIVACWLLPNAVLLTLMAGLFFIMLPLAIIWGCLAYYSWKYGLDALKRAQGHRFKTIFDGWTGRIKKTVPLSGLADGITLSFIGIFGWWLMFIGVSKFSELIRKAAEGAAKGNMGMIRSSLSIYYGDMEGQYPSDLASLTVSHKYLAIVPMAKVPNFHPDSTAVRAGKTPDDKGGWVYNNIAGDPNLGTVFVNCTHTDTRGTTWTSY